MTACKYCKKGTLMLHKVTEKITDAVCYNEECEEYMNKIQRFYHHPKKKSKKSKKTFRERKAEVLGQVIHKGLRMCDGKEAHNAWCAIRDMPYEQWEDVCRNAIKELKKVKP